MGSGSPFNKRQFARYRTHKACLGCENRFVEVKDGVVRNCRQTCKEWKDECEERDKKINATVEVLVKICSALNCGINDMIELIPDDERVM